MLAFGGNGKGERERERGEGRGKGKAASGVTYYVFKTRVEEIGEKGIITSNLCLVRREMGFGGGARG